MEPTANAPERDSVISRIDALYEFEREPVYKVFISTLLKLRW